MRPINHDPLTLPNNPTTLLMHLKSTIDEFMFIYHWISQLFLELQYFLVLHSNVIIPIPLQSSRAYLEPWGHDGRSPFKGSEVWKSSQLHPSSHQRSPISSKLETGAATKQNRWLLTLWSWSRANCFEAGQEQTGALLTEERASREARVATLTRRAPPEECCAARDLL